jgi:hypothetical protein
VAKQQSSYDRAKAAYKAAKGTASSTSGWMPCPECDGTMDWTKEWIGTNVHVSATCRKNGNHVIDRYGYGSAK